MKNNKILIGIIIIILIVIIFVFLITKKKQTYISYETKQTQKENPIPNTPTTKEPSISLPIQQTPPQTKIPDTTISIKNDECKTITGYTCEEYKNGWINIFKIENKLDNTTFNKYISIQSTNFSKQGNNYEFLVNYTVKKSWMTVTRQDSIFLKNSDWTKFLSPKELPLERDLASKGRTDISTINLKDEFAFSSSADALNYYIYKYSLSGKESRIENEDFQYFWNNENLHEPIVIQGGEPYVRIFGVIDEKQNKCFDGDLALISKNTSYNETPCMIN